MTLSDHQAAPSAPAIPTTAVIVRLPLDDLKPSPANPRRIDLDDPKLAEHPDPKPKARKLPATAKAGSGKVAKPKAKCASAKQAKVSMRKQNKGTA